MNENGRAFAPRGPAEIQRYIAESCRELDDLAVTQQTAHEDLEQAEEAWISHYDEIVQQLEDEGGRMPGEDQRISIARRRGGAQKWTNLRRAERNAKRLDSRASQIKTVISACQSEAKMLRETV